MQIQKRKPVHLNINEETRKGLLADEEKEGDMPMPSNTTEKVTRLNLNDTVFFELNDVSLKLLAPTTEEQVRLIRDNVSEHTVDGQTRHLAKMQLHDFIRKFSKAIGPGQPAPIAGNDLYVIENTITVSGQIEPPAKSLKEPKDPREVSHQLMVFLSAHSAKVGPQTWSSQNLAISDDLPGITADLTTGNVYYTYEAAIRIASYAPPGWRLPTKADWAYLFTTASGRFPDPYPGEPIDFRGASPVLRKSYGLFDFRNTGMMLEPRCLHRPDVAPFWTSTPHSDYLAWYALLDESDDATLASTGKSWRLPVRLVHD